MTKEERNALLYQPKNGLDRISAVEEAGLVGEQGPVLTELRPSGSALLEGHPVDVVSEGAFIAKGELVRVISVQGSRVVVRRVEKLPKEAAK